MQLKTVTASSPELGLVLDLYESAFPANERWGMEVVLNDKSGISELFSFFDGGVFCGMAVLLNLGDISHIIYFAVAEGMRGRGAGSEALRLIRELKAGRRLLVDIEREHVSADNNGQRRRRRIFYERCGYSEAGIYYSWRGEQYEIMINGGKIDRGEYFRFWKAVDENSEIFGGE